MLTEKFIRFDSSSRRVLLTALVVVATIGLYRWILAPFGNQLFAAKRYYSALDSRIRKANALHTTLEEKRTKTERLNSEYIRLQNELFTFSEAREFFASLPIAAQEAGCAVQSISRVPEKRVGSKNKSVKDSDIVSRKAVVTVLGRFNNIVKFLEEMHARKHRVWVDTVRVDAGTSGRLKCQVILTIYCIERMEIAVYE